ncbi:MAG: hypothetical protein AAFR22_22725, partial [Chloroflexota bacterium]
ESTTNTVSQNTHDDVQAVFSGQHDEETIMRLQSKIGNREVQRLLQRHVDDRQLQRETDQHGNGCRCRICSGLQRKPDDRTAIQRDGKVDNSPNPSVKDTIAKFEAMKGTHDTVEVAGGPESAAEVRNTVSAASPGSAGEAATLLATCVGQLRGLGLSSTVESQADLIPILAEDNKRKQQAGLPGYDPQSDEEWESGAEQQITANNTTALTTYDDRYTAIEGGVEFDEVHELVHICSAQGGVSPLSSFNTQMNEGAINYFSELVAQQMGVTVEDRYPGGTSMVKRMLAMTGTAGEAALFNATFKGDIDGFFNVVGAAYVALGDNLPNGERKKWGDRQYDAGAAAGVFKDKVANWSVDWLTPRTPAP